MAALLALDPTLLAQANLLAEVSASEHAKLLGWSVDILEGNDVSEAVAQFAEQLGLGSPAKLVKVCTALGTVIWECSKVIKKDSASLPGILVQVGLHEAVVGAFCQTFAKCKSRLAALKAPLGLDVMSYENLAWRLDIQLAKRSLLSTTEPNFQLRLDLVNNAAAVGSDGARQTLHLQSDYANLKLLQDELQRAVDECAGVHNQRITRYIS